MQQLSKQEWSVNMWPCFPDGKHILRKKHFKQKIFVFNPIIQNIYEITYGSKVVEYVVYAIVHYN